MSFFSIKGYKFELKEIAFLAYPMILGQLGVVLMGVADTIMVGKLGTDALASVNQANNLFFMLSGLTFGVLFAVSTLVSIKVGENKASEGFAIYRASLIVSVLLFAFQFIILQVLIHNFHWLGQTGNINVLAPKFLNIVSWSILPILISMSSRQFTDGLGHTKVFMILTIAALVLNIFLNWILIYGNWGAPALGVEGSAYATLISRILMALVGLWYVRYSKLMKQYLPEKMPNWKSVIPEMKPIWKIGVPLALQTFAEWACFALSGVMVGWYGASQLAAHAVALNIASVTYMIASGVAMAGSILAGNSYGEQNVVKLKKVAHATFLLLTIFELFNALIFMLFNKQIAQLYRVDESVMPYILPLLSLAALFQLSDGIQAGAMGLLRGVKDVVWASIISIVSYWVISLPLSFYFGDYRISYINGSFVRVHIQNSIMDNGQVYGVWIGFTVGLFAASIFGVYRFYSRLNKLKF